MNKKIILSRKNSGFFKRHFNTLMQNEGEDAVHAGCGQHKKDIEIERGISHEIEHIFIFLTSTKDGAAAHNSL